MTLSSPESDGPKLDEAASAAEYPIEVVVHGRTLRVTRSMGEIFVRSARTNAASPGCPLTVLAHSDGVELLNITNATPIVVRDLTEDDEPALLDESSCSPTVGHRLPRNDLTERIVAAACEIFAQRSIHEITRDEVLTAAGVTDSELDSEFASLEALAEACLRRREREWTIRLFRAGVEARADQPEEKLLAIFEVLHEWFHRSDYEACTFVSVLLELGKDHPLGRASVEHLTYVRGRISRLAVEAGLADPEEFAYSWHLLMKGAIISAVEGDEAAARRAQAMGRDLIARHRRATDEAPETF
jgi:AcrR family transcriptional regulator